jgi:3-dehydroquinate dehydratase-1
MIQIVGAISKFDTFQALTPEIAHSCDIGEIRFDLMGLPDLTPIIPICRRIRSWPFPLLMTIRLQSEGGQWPDERDRERMVLLQQVLEEVDMIDIEVRSSILPHLLESAMPMKKTIIISHHDFNGTPPLPALQLILSRIQSEAGRESQVIAKIATTIHRREDNFVLLKLLEQAWEMPVCVIGMGSAGIGTRVLFPLLGSRLTYGFLDTACAPGQLSCDELTEYLCRFDREYHDIKKNHRGTPGTKSVA